MSQSDWALTGSAVFGTVSGMTAPSLVLAATACTATRASGATTSSKLRVVFKAKINSCPFAGQDRGLAIQLLGVSGQYVNVKLDGYASAPRLRCGLAANATATGMGALTAVVALATVYTIDVQMVRNSSGVLIAVYLNGAYVGTFPYTGAGVTGFGAVIFAGTENNGCGYIDDVSVYHD